MIQSSQDNDELNASDQPEAPETPGVWARKAYPLIRGGMFAVVIGSVLIGFIGIIVGIIRLDVFWGSIMDGLILTFFIALCSIVAVAASLLIVIPAYVCYGKMLSVPAATIIGLLTAVLFAVIFLAVSTDWYSLEALLLISVCYLFPAAIYGGLTGYFASSIEHRELKQRMAESLI